MRGHSEKGQSEKGEPDLLGSTLAHGCCAPVLKHQLLQKLVRKKTPKANTRVLKMLLEQSAASSRVGNPRIGAGLVTRVRPLPRALCAPGCTQSPFGGGPRVPPAAVTRAGHGLRRGEAAGRGRSPPGSRSFSFPSLPGPFPGPCPQAEEGSAASRPEVVAQTQVKREFSKDLLNLPCVSLLSAFPPVPPHGLPASQQSSCCAAQGWQRAAWG